MILSRRPFHLLVIVMSTISFLSACRVPRSSYGPTTSNVGAASAGQPAAIYEIPLGDGKGGQIQVWTDGIVDDGTPSGEPRSAGSQPRSFRVGFALRNDAASPMTLDPAQVRLILDDMPELRPRERELVSVAQGQSSEIVLRYPVPGRFEQTPPDSYQVGWEVRFGAEVYRQVTPFTRERERGFVPGAVDSSAPADRKYIEGSNAPAPIGIPFGGNPEKR